MRSIRLAAAGCAAALCLTATACSSSAKSATTTSGPATTVAAPRVQPNGQCPFSGSTSSQSEPGASTGSVLDSVAPTASGCIDNVTFGFAKQLASSVTAYQTAAAGTTGAVLVVTFKGTTLGGDLKPTTVLNPKSVNYVSKVQVTSAADDVTFAITLDKQRPFLVSSSQVPAQLVVAIG